MYTLTITLTEENDIQLLVENPFEDYKTFFATEQGLQEYISKLKTHLEIKGYQIQIFDDRTHPELDIFTNLTQNPDGTFSFDYKFLALQTNEQFADQVFNVLDSNDYISAAYSNTPNIVRFYFVSSSGLSVHRFEKNLEDMMDSYFTFEELKKFKQLLPDWGDYLA